MSGGDVPPVTVIAEVACIHEGDRAYLRELARAARDAGADALKFQVFSARESVSPDHPDFAYLERISFTEDEWVAIGEECAAEGLGLFLDASGPFGFAVAGRLGAALKGLKIHSSDVQSPDVVRRVRDFGLPVLVGCGGTPLIDLFEALDVLGPDCRAVLMHGHQSFPKLEGAPGGPPARGVASDELELWRVPWLQRTFPDAQVGLADHLRGEDPFAILAPALAVALGATLIEKHFTLDRRTRREDYFSALEPAEFRQMVAAIRQTGVAVGHDRRTLPESERGYEREMKRAPVLTRSLEAGAAVGPGDVTLVRTGSYESAARPNRAIGRRLTSALPAETTLTNAHFDVSVGVFCNARLASSRLPKKALLPFYGGYTTLGYLLKRLTSYPGDIGQVVLATTTESEDDALAAIAGEVGVPCFRGPAEDVMGRMVGCADAFGWDVLIRVTGDDQLFSGEYIERGLRHHLEHSLDFTRMEGLPLGMGAEIIDVRTLRRIHRAVVNRRQTEYVTWYLDSDLICRNGVISADPADRDPDLRVTLDYVQDYELMREVARRAHERVPGFYVPTATLIATLRELEPEWLHHPDLWPLKRRQVNTDLEFQW